MPVWVDEVSSVCGTDLKNLTDILTYVYGKSHAKKQLIRLCEYQMVEDEGTFAVIVAGQFMKFVER